MTRVALGFALFLSPHLALAAPFAKGPYLQECSATGVSVRVEVDPPTPLRVEIVDPSGTSRTVESKDTARFHAVRVGGLSPGTRYAYTVHSAATRAGGTFLTAPADNATGPLQFLLYGDNRTDDVAHGRVVRGLAGAEGAFFIHTGDFVESGASAPDWQRFFDLETPLLQNRCVFGAVGNHELLDDQSASAFVRYFGPTDAAGLLYSTFRWQNARFFVLNAFQRWESGDQRTWLERELRNSDTEAGLTWRFVVMHQGPYSSGPHGHHARLHKAQIPELFVAHHVDLVFSGHDHLYERGEVQGLHYVLSGGGGAPLYPVRHPHPGSRRTESIHHWVELTAEGVSIKLVARRADGSVLERCGFTKGSPWDCDAPAAQPGSSSLLPAPAPSMPLLTQEPRAKCGCHAVGAPTSMPLPALPLALAFLRRRRARREPRTSPPHD
ncbi:MAG: metallophosphoesterase [Myxococcales bacterium]